MTREELALYALTAFDLGDIVEIDDSGCIGEIVGMEIKIGCEDRYLVAYHDNSDNPQRVYWPASSLADYEPESNVIRFPTRH